MSPLGGQLILLTGLGRIVLYRGLLLGVLNSYMKNGKLFCSWELITCQTCLKTYLSHGLLGASVLELVKAYLINLSFATYF